MVDPVTDSRFQPEDPRGDRGVRLRSHLYRSLGVGMLAAWAVTVERVVSAQPLSVGRWLVTAVLAGAVWFLTGGGSGIVWPLLPASARGERGSAT